MKKIIFLTFLFALNVSAFGQKRDLTKYIGDTVVVKKPSYPINYEGFYKSLRPIPKTTEEITASLKVRPSNDSTILYNDGKGRTPIDKLLGVRFFCSKLIDNDKETYLELQNTEYGTLYYKVSSYGDFVLNTSEEQKKADKLKAELERIDKESQQRRIESKALLSQLTYGADDKYHYKKTVKIAGGQPQTLLAKTKTFFKDYTQTTEGPTWKQVTGTNKVVGTVGRNILMNVTIQSSVGQYTYDISPLEFYSNGTWKDAEVVLASTNSMFDDYRTDILAAILYVSQEIEKKIK